MHILLLLAVAHAFSCLLNAKPHPVDLAGIKVVWSLLGGTTVVAFAWWIAQMRRHSLLGRAEPNWLRSAERLHALVYLGVMLAVFGALDFAQIASVNWSLSRFVLADDAVVGIALVGPLLGSWICLGDVAAHDGHLGSRWSEKWEFVVLQLRHSLLLPLIPILLLTGVSDVVRLMAPSWSPGCNPIVTTGVLVSLLIGLPLIVRLAWPTRVLEDGRQRRILEQTFQSARVPVTEILFWDTQGRMANAAVTGFLPCLRYLLVSDELLARLGDRRLAAIAAHEAGHLAHRHLPRLVLSLAFPVLLLLVLLIGSTNNQIGSVRREVNQRETFASATAITPMPEQRDQPLIRAESVENGPPILFSPGIPFATLVTLIGWLLLHGWLAQLFEYQADAAACQLLSQESSSELTEESVHVFCSSLIAIGADPKGDWLHPKPAQRMAQLDRWRADPSALSAFHTRLKRMSWLHAVLAILLLLICLVLA